MIRRAIWFLPALLLVLPPLSAPAQTPAAPPQLGDAPVFTKAGSFKIVFDPALQPEPYSGRVYLVMTSEPAEGTAPPPRRRGRGEPRLGMNAWSGGPEIVAQDVNAVVPGGSVVVRADSIAYPTAFKDLEPGRFTVQAVARRSLDSPTPGTGPGDLYSETVRIAYAPGDAGVTELKLTKAVEARPFTETQRIKLVEIVSPSLSKFYGREVTVRAGVLLPEGWKDDPALHYPTIYMVTGFGGDHNSIRGLERRAGDETGKGVLFVVPDPLCHYGHSVFADSENNGPRGTALVEELIPEIEKRFHGAQSPTRRFVTGGSSGGWGSLWLQITYPDSFGGCWSHCPDPVDFRDFQQIDLYTAGTNIYKDEKGQRRPLARSGGNVTLWYDDFVKREWVLGPGGQIQSFEGVFSKRGADGEPEQLFDRTTGNVDPRVATTWEKYDIRLVLERNWATLGPKLKGKLHIYAGEVDTFYLEGAARLLKTSLDTLGSDAVCEIIPGMPHTIYTPGWEDMMKAAMKARDN